MIVRYCGRDFTKEDIELIQKSIAEKPERNRSQISRVLSMALQWYKPDGGLKDMSCRVALLRMHKDGLIKLPPPLKRNNNGKSYNRCTKNTDPKNPIHIPVNALPNLRLELVTKRRDSYLYNEYISATTILVTNHYQAPS